MLSILLPLVFRCQDKDRTDPPEVLHGGDSAEGILGVRELGVEEEFTHHLGVVVHSWAGHSEGHC